MASQDLLRSGWTPAQERELSTADVTTNAAGEGEVRAVMPEVGDIEKAVCETFGLAPSSLQSGRKAKRVSHPRMLAMWLARRYNAVPRWRASHPVFLPITPAKTAVVDIQQVHLGWMRVAMPYQGLAGQGQEKAIQHPSADDPRAGLL